MTYCFVEPHLEPFSGLAMDAKRCQLRFSKVTWPVWIIDSISFDLLIWWLEKSQTYSYQMMSVMVINHGRVRRKSPEKETQDTKKANTADMSTWYRFHQGAWLISFLRLRPIHGNWVWSTLKVRPGTKKRTYVLYIIVVILLMAEILDQLTGSLSHDLQGLYIPGDSVAVCFAFWNSKHYVSFFNKNGLTRSPGSFSQGPLDTSFFRGFQKSGTPIRFGS